MPLSTLECKAHIRTAGEELSTTPLPFFGVNIIDIAPENLEKFRELGKPFGEPGHPIHEILRFKHHHTSMRDYGNGRIRILALYYYQHEIDYEAYRKISEDDPAFIEQFMKWAGCMENYIWFTSCEIPGSPAAG